ncbi:MAG: branched-chain amino acid aminotransferase [Flavobacteriales bacterium]|jgi:branched-chain amino acid aminotransferase|uniref:branched-chain amino acid aminotransferase n=1 Tax=Blattabacterium sp. (Mastotermes darwiniensis) TaxID=39768 RepID=UPI000231DDBB|nr:branched-chain amino acid aminotransferase [Blattabacterium sp. (Mastotermes darwiniensis)]AER40495.1 branched-chain amino acid aminotransferase [Blattabacterium sp. (Mastotermes darwiniensis) str. MADAR]MDR1804990.1 branched-chain amino acid aminotransferase [Flavobacteriales bacterium]
MKIEKVLNSRINNMDFNNISFGNSYSDHIFCSEFRNGKWINPIIQPFENMMFSPGSLVFHYGQAVFEGMKAYKDKNEEVFLFRPEENFKRMNRSAIRLEMPTIPKYIFMNGLKNLIGLDRNWIPKNYGQSLYIRPLLIATDVGLSVNPSNDYLFMIMTTPSDAYYKNPLKIKIEEKYSRSSPGGVGFTKYSGNYAPSFYPIRLAREEGFDQILWTDSSTHTLIEESDTMNVCFWLKDKLVTPLANEKILNGITCKSVLSLAKKEGIDIQKRNLSVSEIIDGLKKGFLKEAFGCGTAVVITYFQTISYKGKNFYLPDLPDEERISIFLKKRLLDIQHNLSEDPFGWRLKLEKIL